MSERKGRLFSYGALEPRDEIDERLEKCHGEWVTVRAKLKENELHNHLSDKVSRSGQEHEDVTMALLYSILTEPSTAAQNYHTLTLITRDSLGHMTTCAERIIMEKMGKMQETTRVQMLWLTREMVQTGVAGADRLCFALLKQLPAGSVCNEDIYIIEALMHVLLDNKEWLEAQAGLISSTVYTYLSLAQGHMTSALGNLRDQEAQFCAAFIRNRFVECSQIGRDLLRLLQAVARIPEFTELWKDLLQSPQKFSPPPTTTSVVQQLLSRRTSRRFIGGRILCDAEVKLNFLLSRVKFGQHKKYQEWFQKKYLSTPESLSQIPEFIRLICCVIHPTNEVLASDITPRWAVIGWLLSLCQANVVVFANAKAALFYDWLGYNTDTDNIMNIEPGVLLMHYSLRTHPQVTASLLDFLCRLMPSYCPSAEQFVADSMKAALRDILQKGVLLSLEPMFESPRLDEELKALVRATFPEFCSRVATMEVLESGGEEEEGGGASSNEDAPIIIASDEDLQGQDDEVSAVFSDEEEERACGSQGFAVVQEWGGEGGGGEDPWARIDELPPPLKEQLLEVRETNDPVVQAGHLQQFLALLEEAGKSTEGEGQVGVAMVAVAAAIVADCLAEELSNGCSERSSTSTAETAAATPLECMLRALSSLPPVPSISQLAVATLPLQPRLGYFLLHHLLLTTSPLPPSPPSPLTAYLTFVSGFSLSLKACLLRDMKECAESEPAVFFSLVPAVYKQFPQELVGCADMLAVVVSSVDPAHLHSLVHSLLTKEFVMFGRQMEAFQSIISSSLQWDSFEQFCVWQLLSAESPEPHLIIPALASLNSEEHPEAITSALLFLKHEPSTQAGIGALLVLPPRHHAVVDAVASRWLSSRTSKYAKLISQCFESIDKRSSEPLAMYRTVLGHLQRLVGLGGNRQVLEVSEMMLSKALLKLFSNHSELTTSFEELNKLVTKLADSAKKEPTRKSGAGERASKSSEPKAKKRRIVNRDDLTDS